MKGHKDANRNGRPTIVNTTMSEAYFRQHMMKQLRGNDRCLLNRLADADGDANVGTEFLKVDESLTNLIRRYSTAVDAAIWTGKLDHAVDDEENIADREYHTRSISI